MSSYPPELITRCLFTLAKHGGDSEKAHTELSEQIPADELPTSRTLRRWRDTYHDQYVHIHEQHIHEIEASLAPEFRELSLAATQAARQAVTQTVQALQAGNLKDPAGAARNLTVTAATAMDKLYLATDRPTEARTDTNARELITELRHLLGQPEPIQDAQVIEPTALPRPSASE